MGPACRGKRDGSSPNATAGALTLSLCSPPRNSIMEMGDASPLSCLLFAPSWFRVSRPTHAHQRVSSTRTQRSNGPLEASCCGVESVFPLRHRYLSVSRVVFNSCWQHFEILFFTFINRSLFANPQQIEIIHEPPLLLGLPEGAMGWGVVWADP